MKKSSITKKNLINKLSVIAVLVLMGSIVFNPVMAFATEEQTEEETDTVEDTRIIPDGITFNGTDVSGMTVSEAEAVIDDYLASFEDARFTLNANGKSVTATPSKFGLTVRKNDVIEKALSYGNKGNFVEKYKAVKDKEEGVTKNFALVLDIDPEVSREFFLEHSKDLDDAGSDCTLKHENGEFVFVEGSSGTVVDVEASTAKLASFVQSNWNGEGASIDLITKVTKPLGNKEELSVIKDVLGTYTTDYSTSSSARKANVANGCSKINGKVLYPGQTISVAETVNPMTAENGYQLAGSYENGTTVETYGGGICQVSSTLYNAVMRAELEIVTRSAHSMVVSYVEPSMDAAIAGYAKDFQFKNNKEYPVYIEGITTGNKITFTIYGVETRDPSRVVTFESEIVEQIDPVNTYVASAAEGVGYLARTQGAHTGYKARLWKIVTENGVEVERRIYNNSRYNVSNPIYTVGIASDNPSATAAMQAAIATQDEATIRATMAQFYPGAAPAPAAPDQPVATSTDYMALFGQ